jgi:hypothetical protein
MNRAMFYLVCFLVGVALSMVSFVGASLHLPHLHLHLPHGHVTCRMLVAQAIREPPVVRIFHSSTLLP